MEWEGLWCYDTISCLVVQSRLGSLANSPKLLILIPEGRKYDTLNVPQVMSPLLAAYIFYAISIALVEDWKACADTTISKPSSTLWDCHIEVYRKYATCLGKVVTNP